jgi:autophagy-related protein 9
MSSAAQNDPDYTTPTAKLDAHDIANRIMRQENYLIALFNKDLLDLRLPLPRPLKTVLGLLGVYHELKQGTILTHALEWNLRFCLMDYLFDRSGRVRPAFLKDRNRELLVKG